jgi:hypothetical protein
MTNNKEEIRIVQEIKEELRVFLEEWNKGNIAGYSRYLEKSYDEEYKKQVKYLIDNNPKWMQQNIENHSFYISDLKNRQDMTLFQKVLFILQCSIFMELYERDKKQGGLMRNAITLK